MIRRTVRRIRLFLASEDGPTAAEYAIMLVLILLVIITAVMSVGSNTKRLFSTTAPAFSNVNGS